MDRTNWKFGQQNINVLVLAVVYHGVAFPLLFKLLPVNSGECEHPIPIESEQSIPV